VSLPPAQPWLCPGPALHRLWRNHPTTNRIARPRSDLGAIAEAYQALSKVNYERLASWFPGFDQPPTLERTRAALERSGQAWLGGSRSPLAIAVKAGDRWRLVGAVSLLIDGPARSGKEGYWLDAGFEGRGLVMRAVAAVLDHAFGPIGLHGVELRTNRPTSAVGAWPSAWGSRRRANCVKQRPSPTNDVMTWSNGRLASG
jgi:RimJ/RimL family protein N-acetyltransferase